MRLCFVERYGGCKCCGAASSRRRCSWPPISAARPRRWAAVPLPRGRARPSLSAGSRGVAVAAGRHGRARGSRAAAAGRGGAGLLRCRRGRLFRWVSLWGGKGALKSRGAGEALRHSSAPLRQRSRHAAPRAAAAALAAGRGAAPRGRRRTEGAGLVQAAPRALPLRTAGREDAGERLQGGEGGRAGEEERRAAAALEEEALHPHRGGAAPRAPQAAAPTAAAAAAAARSTEHRAHGQD